MKKEASWGNTVSICYRGGVLEKDPVDERTDKEPLTVMIGDLKLPRGIEEALVGMKPGEEKRVTIPPNKAYGKRQESLTQWYPRLMLDGGELLQVGDVVFYTDPNDGHKQPAFITKTTQDNVLVDLNHPFADETLDYWIKLIDVR